MDTSSPGFCDDCFVVLHIWMHIKAMLLLAFLHILQLTYDSAVNAVFHWCVACCVITFWKDYISTCYFTSSNALAAASADHESSDSDEEVTVCRHKAKPAQSDTSSSGISNLTLHIFSSELFHFVFRVILFLVKWIWSGIGNITGWHR